MNKYKKAILDLSFITSNLKFVKVGGKENIKKSLNELNELVEQDTPDKVLKSYELFSIKNGLCPKCKSIVQKTELHHNNYCGNCGKALDWTDEK